MAAPIHYVLVLLRYADDRPGTTDGLLNLGMRLIALHFNASYGNGLHSFPWCLSY